MSSVEARGRALLERARLNFQILENPYWHWTVEDDGHANFVQVGRGQRTSPSCGQWRHFWVCDNVEGHKGVVLKGIDYTGKFVVCHQHIWCHKPICPVCFVRGYAVRESRSIGGRLEVASERGLGKIEHVVVSVPIADRDLPEPVLKERCRAALFDRGVTGGTMIFHGRRINKRRGVLEWSIHFHMLGFIEGGFDRCRECVHDRTDCASCDGFKGREVRGFAKDGYLVKVEAERRTIVGTAFYQLHHATTRLGIRRFHIVTWFGVCGNRKYKGRKTSAVHVCPACRGDMEKKFYVGGLFIAKNIGDPRYMKTFRMSPLDASGSPNFVDAGGGRFE